MRSFPRHAPMFPGATVLLIFVLASVSHSQTTIQKFVQSQHTLWTAAAQLDVSDLDAIADSNYNALDTLLDAAAFADSALSADCAEDLAELVAARLGNFSYPEFARQVWLPVRDSAGRVGPAVLKGHVYFAGHFSEVAVDLLLRSNTKNGSCNVIDSGILLAWSFGVCLPASCKTTELERLLISGDTKHSPVCRMEQTNDSIEELDAGFWIVMTIVTIIVLACVLSGIVDFFFTDYFRNKPASKGLPWRLFMCFSLYSNVYAIFDTSDAAKPGQIAPIHCIRFFSMCWMVIGHLTSTFMGAAVNPLDIIAIMKDLTTEFVTNSYFCVDSFLFIGGLLLSMLWLKAYHRDPKQTNSSRAWVMFYVHRYLRISPPFYIMVVFYTYVYIQLLHGSPVNMNGITRQDDCRDAWWFQLTYIPGIGNGNSCLGYTWYLATDMMIFVFTPILLLPLAMKPVVGFVVAAVICCLSIALNIYLVMHHHWPATVPFLGPTDPLETNSDKYMNYVYSNPMTRCPVYIIGMLVGWFLHTKKSMRINPVLNVALWMLSFAVMLTVVLGLHQQTNGDLIPVFWRAMYSAFSKPAWALALAWIIVSCHYGYGGPINAFMSWHVWMPLGRLSYCAYLIHDPLLILILTQSYDEYYFSSFTDFIITRFVPIIALICFVSIFWSALFEMSFGKAENLLLGQLRPATNTQQERRKPSTCGDSDDDKVKIRL